MVSESELIGRLREFLRSSDLNTTTTTTVRRQLESDFGIDLSDRKAFIREQVDLFLQTEHQQQQEEEEEEGEEAFKSEQSQGSNSKVEENDDDDDDDYDYDEPTPQDLEYVAQIKRVLELLKKNRDMLYGEVKLTIMIEDPREIERRSLLGIEDPDAPTRDDLVAALEEVNEGKIPKDKVALQMLAEELAAWPNVEAEAPKKKTTKSLYAKATDTGIDPQVVAKKLKVDWDTAAEIEDTEAENDTEVPSALGYGALYLVTAFPVIIGISVVLILFYNSLQ
ncbi:PREDICTED: ycf3-interacting protein 1, chloroplastic [Lupinus angustifolius]|uniref:ycf3-interacting protein 1, chloroplastic n=1 Tax=Lupinus angustifolius TaxID=3871 RepID=UPI00092E625F|nr:PREDICTED: ycf3-interacting protein 1, chloroplastic [Lupinus angustifolius]